MKLIVGLGNPGRKYRRTRHNVGFEVLAQLASQFGTGKPRQRFEGEVVEANLDRQKVLLLSPLTYMNRSGSSVRPAQQYFDLDYADLLVVCDDFNLPLGSLRFRRSGSAGGQNGLRDIINRLETDQFPRLRIGVGPLPNRIDPADFVLERFQRTDRDAVSQVIDQAATGAVDWVREGIDSCMNRYN